MSRAISTFRQPIVLAISLAGMIAILVFVSWGAWGGRRSADLVPLFGYVVFLAWFGTGLALAIGHPVARIFLASTLLPPVILAVFWLGWLISPNGMYRAWPLAGGLLLLVLGICSIIGFVTASIGWCNGFRHGRFKQVHDRGDEARPR